MKTRAPRRRAPLLAPLLLALLAAAGCGSEGTPERLTARFVELLYIKMPGASVRVVAPLRVEIRGPGGAVTQDLHSLWQQCQLTPDSCDANVRRAVRLLARNQALASLKLDRKRVVAVIKDTGWVEATGRSLRSAPGGKAPGVELVASRLVGDLWMVSAFDLPDGIRMMNGDDLKRLGLTQEQVETVAVANLRALAPPPRDPVEPGSRVFREHAGDGYESSRLLLHERWGKVAQEMKGDLLVSVPSNGTLLYTGSGEGAAAVGRFRELTRELNRQEPHPVSDTILRYLPAGWAVVSGPSSPG
ncbi:MAG TPA: DUF1444 family protein [Thermoanaerobaculia bacterium]|nr:DUF1444 family protein [Thermoanaerobaculia bacterium]